MTETVIVAVLSLIGTMAGAYFANKKSAALIAYRLEELEHEPLVAAPSSLEHRTRKWLDALFAQIPGLLPKVVHTVPNINMYDYYAKSGTASYILASREIPSGACRMEPDQALPYETYFVQSRRADSKTADILFRILDRQINHG